MTEFNYCPQCGGAVEHRETHGAVRPVCTQCGRVHFIDPKVAVGLLIQRQGQLLLVRRANDPERGKWSIPAGFVDAGEDPARAAEREAREETGLEVRAGGVVGVFARGGDSDGADILIVYHAATIGGELAPGDDAAEAAYFGPQTLPELAFASTRRVVELWRNSV